METNTALRLARSGGVHAAAAFLAMGAWAVFANRAHGLDRALLAGAVQGTISAAITLMLKRSLEAMAARLRAPAAFVIPPLVTCALVLTALLSLHRLLGTPEIWATIAVPYAVSSIYAFVYAASLGLASARAARGG